MCNLRIILFLFTSFSSVLTKNATSISDSLAVESTIYTGKSPTSLPSETKSKTEKRESSDQLGQTILKLKEEESFRPITSKPYQKTQPQLQQIHSSLAPSTLHPTTVRYIAEETRPQTYYDRPTNRNPIPNTSNTGRVTNFVEEKRHHGITRHSYRGPFKEPYQLQVEQTQPQILQQQSQYLLKPRFNLKQYIQPANVLQNYASQSLNTDILSLEQEQQAQSHQRQLYTQQRQINQNVQQRQSNQPQPLMQKQLEQKTPYTTLEGYAHPQYQQFARRNHYIIAIPLSYVRHLQYQSTEENIKAPTPAQQQVAISLPSPTSHVPPQLPFTMSLILKEIARSHPAVYPAPHLLNMQPQLIRHTPQQLQVKQRNQLSHYVQQSGQQQPHASDQRNAHQAQYNFQPQPQHERVVSSVVKPTIKQVLSSSHSAVTAEESQSPSPPQDQHASTAAPLPLIPPILYFNPAYVQAAPPEQYPALLYASYIPSRYEEAQHAAAIVKLSPPSTLLPSQTAQEPIYHLLHSLQPSFIRPDSLVTAISPLSFMLTKAPAQQPGSYMMQQKVVNSIGPSLSGAGLPYFIHPAGIQYGTHLYNPGISLVISKRLESERSVDAEKQQIRHFSRPEQDKKSPQQQLGPPEASAGNDDNNAIVKYA